MEKIPNGENSAIQEIPKVVVCIPAYNEAKYIGIIVQNALKHANEVIVCDGKSTYESIIRIWKISISIESA